MASLSIYFRGISLAAVVLSTTPAHTKAEARAAPDRLIQTTGRDGRSYAIARLGRFQIRFDEWPDPVVDTELQDEKIPISRRSPFSHLRSSQRGLSTICCLGVIWIRAGERRIGVMRAEERRLRHLGSNWMRAEERRVWKGFWRKGSRTSTSRANCLQPKCRNC